MFPIAYTSILCKFYSPFFREHSALCFSSLIPGCNLGFSCVLETILLIFQILMILFFLYSICNKCACCGMFQQQWLFCVEPWLLLSGCCQKNPLLNSKARKYSCLNTHVSLTCDKLPHGKTYFMLGCLTCSTIDTYVGHVGMHVGSRLAFPSVLRRYLSRSILHWCSAANFLASRFYGRPCTGFNVPHSCSR